MLGKLIKYDLKSTNRFLILIHAFFIAASLFIRFFLTGKLLASGTDWDSEQTALSLALTIILYVVLLMFVSFATYLIIIVRFYKNLFSDQGYLTHTLPVTSGQHLLAKTISGSIWGVIDTGLILLSVYIVLVTPYVTDIWTKNQALIREELGFTGVYADFSWMKLGLLFAGFMILGVVGNIIMYYMSVVIGQLVPGHRILGAIAAYFGITMVVSVLSLLILAVSGLFGASIQSQTEFNTIAYFINTLKVSGAFSLITAVLEYIAAYWIMKRKINLE